MAAAASSSSSEGSVGAPAAFPLYEAAAAADSGSGSGGDREVDCLDNIALQETALVKGCDHACCFVGDQRNLPVDKEAATAGASSGSGSGGADRVVDCGVCAICLDKIALQETALVKGCDHAYCVTCILRWASYKQTPLCPQCKHPFEFLSVHRSLDGCLYDYLFEESVCLLLRATWFEPLVVEAHEEALEDDFYHQYQYQYDDDEDDLYEEAYYMSRSPSIRIGNRRWGDSGYIRGGRREARPVNTDATRPSRTPKKKETEASTSGSGSVSKDVAGRRAKRAQKREAADKAAAEKHLKHLQRLGLAKAPEVPAEVGPQVNE